ERRLLLARSREGVRCKPRVELCGPNPFAFFVRYCSPTYYARAWNGAPGGEIKVELDLFRSCAVFCRLGEERLRKIDKEPRSNVIRAGWSGKWRDPKRNAERLVLCL